MRRIVFRAGVARLPNVLIAASCCYLVSGCTTPIDSDRKSTTRAETRVESLEETVAKLRGLSVDQEAIAGGGGGYAAIGSNIVTAEVVAKGERIVPLLIERLKACGCDEAVFIVLCLRELRAVSAKAVILELERSLTKRERFADSPHQATLRVQMIFFLRDADTWPSNGGSR